jgi:hypothetical protein
VLSSYRLARIESITAGFDLAEARAEADGKARAEASAGAPAIPVTA